MTRIFTLCLALLLSLRIFAQTAQPGFSSHGTLIKTSLSSAPFPHPRRAQGHTYGKRLYPAQEHYNDSSVAFFIPKGFRSTESVDFLIHLHGWWNNIDTVLERFRLPRQVAESGKNVILVVPEGPRNAPDSFGGKLEDPGGLKRFVDDAVVFLYRSGHISAQTVGNVFLSGHSGAYHTISYALMWGGITERVREVYLFDALYGQTEKFAHWIDHFNAKMIVVYTDSGGTKGETESLMEDLRAWQIPHFSGEEASVSSETLQNTRLLFLHSDLGHDMVLYARQQLRSYLKASCLADR